MNTFFNKEINFEFSKEIKYQMDIPFLGLNLNDIKVVILGESPCKDSNGLAFSTSGNLGKTCKNIFLEIKNNTGIQNTNGDLTSWKYQGILLINAIPVGNSEILKFQNLTRKIITELSKQCEPIIFVMWGDKIQKFNKFIDKKHFILTSSHPNPYYSNVSFFGNQHFSRINEILEKQGKTQINWET